ncbi:hypothetical protein [Pseudomonas moorei]|uniref:hypothetical protein n=1 Tax=Pseudomonas moorei TaxID=395599 RepID=UPI00200FD16D|nr:hypothetical protein [Pseudomonas moorei]
MTTSVRWKTLLPRAAIAVCVTALFLYYGAGFKDEKLQSIAGVIAGVAGTLLGFLITAVALLTAVMDRTLIANMRKTGHYQRLVEDTFTTCTLLLGVVVASIFSLFFESERLHCAFAILVLLCMLGLLYVFEAGRRFSVVIKALS